MSPAIAIPSVHSVYFSLERKIFHLYFVLLLKNIIRFEMLFTQKLTIFIEI